MKNESLFTMSNIRKCEICGNLISFIEDKEIPLICCGQEMTKVEVITGEEGFEKHKPVIDITDNGILVKVGSITHPMDEEHYIVLIQILDGDKVIAGRKLKPGDKPEFEFKINKDNFKDLSARAYCNKHGLWKS